MGNLLHRTRAAAAVTALASAAALAVTTAAPAGAATAVPTVKVRMSANAITLKGGGASTGGGVTRLRAGRIHFHVVSAGGAHTLQLLRFRNGYTAQQAQSDFNDAFSGNVAAVQRIDHGVVFRGGADAKPKHAGDMVAFLRAGEYMAVDQNGNAAAVISVVGKPAKRGNVAHRGAYTAFTYGWGVSKRLPAKGTVTFANASDQPHFLVLQRVKASTTAAKVRRFVASGSQKNPSWALKASADAGVVSPGTSQLVSYDLPPGKYLVLCFWPDYFTGKPHFMMGMWKLVTLS